MRNRYISNVAFIDLLFNLILGFTFLFLVAFLLINKPDKTEDVEQKAEFLLVMFWQDGHEGDVDIWVDTPNGLVNYVSPTVGAVHLDKDDLGRRNDWYYNAVGIKEYININREIVTFRAKQAGDYVVNAHYYSAKKTNSSEDIQVPATVTIEFMRLNPFQLIESQERILHKQGDEATFYRFSITPEGFVRNVNYVPKSLVTINKPTYDPTIVRQDENDAKIEYESNMHGGF